MEHYVATFDVTVRVSYTHEDFADYEIADVAYWDCSDGSCRVVVVRDITDDDCKNLWSLQMSENPECMLGDMSL
jgi:hypothetical protein